jgi:hypothetical protein
VGRPSVDPNSGLAFANTGVLTASGLAMRIALRLVKRSRVAEGLAWAALALTVVAATGGLAVAGLYRDNAAMIRQAQASDLATLAVAVPVLAIGLWRARAGSTAGRFVAIGALGFVAYTYAIFAFSVVIGPATPLHIAIVGLATWSLVLMVASVEGSPPDPALAARLPRRTTAAFLLVVATLFTFTWLGLIAGAITSGHLPPAVSDLGLPTNPVYTLDLAFALPLLAVGGVRLLRGEPRGPGTALALLVFSVLIGVAVRARFLVEVRAAGAADAPPAPFFAAVVLTGTGLMVLALAPARRGPLVAPVGP